MATSQLLILGNGFDLHCGLKSSYKDFFRNVILDTSTESFGIEQLQVGVTGFWESLLLEYYKLRKKDDYNWCDIEKIIKDILLSIYYGKKPQDKNIMQGIFGKASQYYNKVTMGLELDKLNSIEKFLFDYCVKFILLKGNEFAITLKSLIKHLLEQLYDLEKRFCQYLKNQIAHPNNNEELNTNYIISAINLLAKLTGFSDRTYNNIDNIIHKEFKEIEEETGRNRARRYWKDVNVLSSEFIRLGTTNILSFNYTALFDILSVGSPCLYSNVHGKLCNKNCIKSCESSNVIFGIDDIIIQSQGTSSELRKFSKTYRKMYALGNPSNILPPNTSNPIEIKFYGHSLSEADYSYFQSIFDYYDLYGNSNVSLTFHYSMGYEQHDAIYKLISEYGKSLTNKEQGKNLIHKLLLENRLIIKEI